jgi:hypothetical protein
MFLRSLILDRASWTMLMMATDGHLRLLAPFPRLLLFPRMGKRRLSTKFRSIEY